MPRLIIISLLIEVKESNKKIIVKVKSKRICLLEKKNVIIGLEYFCRKYK